MTFQVKEKKIHIDNYYIFVGAVAVVKLFLMGMFSSDYQDRLFYPFVRWFVDNGKNPYVHFVREGIKNPFPYPPVMLFVESTGAMLIKMLSIPPGFLTGMVFKLPGFVLDLAGLHFLARLFPSKRRYAAVVWYASPVILYAVYMHGQLDLIPTVFLLASVYYLSSREDCRLRKGTAFLVLALLSKLHILAVLPLIFMYLLKRDGFRKAAAVTFVTVTGTVLGILPFWSEEFSSMVLFNEEQEVLTALTLKFSSVDLYVTVVAVLILYLAAFGRNLINRELFLSLCGMVFAVFLIFCPPMPGWYVWVVPYTAVFFMNVDLEKYKNIAVYMLLNMFYLIYFVFFHRKELADLYCLGQDLSWLKIQNSVWADMAFTLLSGTLVYIVCSMYQLGISGNSLYRRRNLPFTIGIAGDSGSGKSTMIGLVQHCLGRNNLLCIEGDGDHKWERGDSRWETFTHLNPKANHLYRQAQDLRQLRVGSAVRRTDYDHATGKFTKAHKIRPKSYVLLCGLHAMYLPQTRRYLDLKIYMDIEEKLRRYWKIRRDVARRGYTEDTIMRQIEERMPDAARYIYPQKEYADMQVRYYDKTLADCTAKEHDISLSLRVTVSSAINAEILIDELEQCGMAVDYDYSDDLGMQIIDIDAEQLKGHRLRVEETAVRIIPQLEEITKEKLDMDSDLEGIIVLFLLLCISSKMSGGNAEHVSP